MAHLRKPQVLVPLLVLAGLVFWGGRRAYCHLHGRMSRAATASAAEERSAVVTVAQPIRKTAVRSITMPASVEALSQATLYAKVSGYVQWIKVDKGDRVKKGEALALLEVPEMDKQYQSAMAAVQQARAEEERAQAEVALKQVTYKRLADVRQAKPDVLPQQDVDAARAAYEVAQGDAKLSKAKVDLARAEVGRLEALQEYAKITAPFDGVVTARFVDPGALIQQGTNSTGNPVLTVANMDTVRVYLSLPEPEVPNLKRGALAHVRLDAFPGKTFEGRVTRFATALDPQTRTMKTEIDLPNPGHLVRPGMYGTAELELASEQNALFLPAQSVRRDSQGKAFVYVVVEGRIRKENVEAVSDDGKLIQVKGLRGEETVVLSGTANLHEGLLVKIVTAGS